MLPWIASSKLKLIHSLRLNNIWFSRRYSMFLGAQYLVFCCYIIIIILFVMKCWHVYSVFCSNISQRSKLQKIQLIRIINTIIANKKIPTITELATLHQICPFRISLPSIPYNSPFLISSPPIRQIPWRHRYGRQPVSR